MHKKPTLTLSWLTVFIVTALTAIFAPCLSAGNNWLERGASVLETLQKDANQNNEGTNLSLDEISKGFKEALQMGTDKVVTQLGALDGFNMDSNIHIPLPEQLGTVKDMLDKVGMSHLLSDLELKLNRAAEAATPKAKSLFVQSITDMGFEDVKKIYDGPENAATQYFKEKMSPQLIEEMKPIIEASLSEVGAIQAYDKVMNNYQSLPLVPDVKADLTDYVVTKGMDGIFYYIAKEEAAIRQNPAKRTTELLRRVFGAK